MINFCMIKLEVWLRLNEISPRSEKTCYIKTILFNHIFKALDTQAQNSQLYNNCTLFN